MNVVAKIVKAVKRHSRYEELNQLATKATDELYYGSTAQCSCGKYFTLKSNQRDGDYWEVISSDWRDR